ncbi:carboxypeptidase-like regulatory domain-containing protein [Arachidicoccus ginsenosidimutans]|uniref:carboxypeptidase-like regulatory domain-containing protein n=1 Tax=Arachidicoccus sp. BS20 TaxID=1850526 RepID=UPI0018D476CB|nr:carboxypeptidase-like regulatory domain-containing protein [Arachidicoccus sp. BS20]
MKKSLFVAIFSFFCIKIFAQQISSYVYNKNGETLVAATVRNISTNKATITNGKGYFELNTTSSNDKLSVEYIGYDTKEILASSLIKNDTIFINQSSHNLQDVVISNEDKYELVRRIIAKTKQALPPYCTYNYYFKDFIKIGGKIKYYSDALVETDFNLNKNNTYLSASRSLKKIDSTDEKVVGKLKVFEHIDRDFSYSALFKYYVFINDKKPDIAKNYRIRIINSSDSLLKISFQPIGKQTSRTQNLMTWFVNKKDSLIREIQLKLLPSQIGKPAASNLANKQYWINNEEIFKYEKKDDNLLLNSVYVTQIKNETSRFLTSFKPFEYQADEAIIVTNTQISNKEIPKSKDKKTYHWYETLQSLGKNYTTPFWENIYGIQQTQDEKDFFSR